MAYYIPANNQTFGKTNYQEVSSKRSYGPFGTKPAWASAFISVSILSNFDAHGASQCPQGHRRQTVHHRYHCF